MGCILFLLIGIAIASWGGIDIQCEGPDIKNIIMFLVGIGMIAFGLFSVVKASEYYHEKERPETEIIVSVPAQIDTIITIKNSIPDTSYVYKFNSKE